MARTPYRIPYRPHSNPGSSQGVWAWAAFGALLGALWAVLQFAPALWLQQAAHAASAGRLELSSSMGTLWQGSAELTLGGGPGSKDTARLPGRLQWVLRPGLDGLQIVLHLRLHADCCTPQPLELTLTPGLRSWRLQLAAGSSHWPAEVLAGLGTPWNTVQLQGPLVLSTPGLRLESALNRLRVEGALRLDLPDLRSRLSTLRPLGSYRLLLQGGEQATLDLQTLEGSLQLQGSGRWTAGHLRFEGEARADAAHAAELSNLLNIMGRRDGARSLITLG
jgi:general secretion pathway protein N